MYVLVTVIVDSLKAGLGDTLAYDIATNIIIDIYKSRFPSDIDDDLEDAARFDFAMMEASGFDQTTSLGPDELLPPDLWFFLIPQLMPHRGLLDFPGLFFAILKHMKPENN